MKRIIYILVMLTSTAYSQTIVNYNRFLRSNFGSQTMWDGVALNIYGITPMLSASPVITAPTIYCNEGDSVVINTLSISQLHHHTIHLHGLDADTRNDGDPATSFELHHMQDTTYSFKANHAGTYIYHCHVGDVVHVQMGMYGSVIVRAAGGANTAWTGGPAFDREYNFLTSEIDRSWHDSVPVHDTTTNTVTIPPYLPDYFLINGKSEWQLDADSSLRVEGSQGEFIYLRLSNIGFCDNKYVFPTSLQAQIIDSDGRPLPFSFNSDTLYVSPGERYGVMLNPNAQLIDSIFLTYINLNTGNVINTQYIDVNIIGYIGLEYPIHSYCQVFPNPTSEVIQIKVSDQWLNKELYVQVMDVNGKIQAQQNYKGNTNLSLGKLPDGIYFISISDGTSVVLKKVVKQ
jgi:hypothetical protein